MEYGLSDGIYLVNAVYWDRSDLAPGLYGNEASFISQIFCALDIYLYKSGCVHIQDQKRWTVYIQEILFIGLQQAETGEKASIFSRATMQ